MLPEHHLCLVLKVLHLTSILETASFCTAQAAHDISAFEVPSFDFKFRVFMYILIIHILSNQIRVSVIKLYNHKTGFSDRVSLKYIVFVNGIS